MKTRLWILLGCSSFCLVSTSLRAGSCYEFAKTQIEGIWKYSSPLAKSDKMMNARFATTIDLTKETEEAASERSYWTKASGEIDEALSYVPRISFPIELYLNAIDPIVSSSYEVWGNPKAAYLHFLSFPRSALLSLYARGYLAPDFNPKVSEARASFLRSRAAAHLALSIALKDANSHYAQQLIANANITYLQSRQAKLGQALQPLGATNQFLEWIKDKESLRPDLSKDAVTAFMIAKYEKALQRYSGIGSSIQTTYPLPNHQFYREVQETYSSVWADLAGIIISHLQSNKRPNPKFLSENPSFFQLTADGKIVSEVAAFDMADEDLAAISPDPRVLRKPFPFSYHRALDFLGECQTCGAEEWAYVKAQKNVAAELFFEKARKFIGEKYLADFQTPKKARELLAAVFNATLAMILEAFDNIDLAGKNSVYLPREDRRNRLNDLFVEKIETYYSGTSTLQLEPPHSIGNRKVVKNGKTFKVLRKVPEPQSSGGDYVLDLRRVFPQLGLVVNVFESIRTLNEVPVQLEVQSLQGETRKLIPISLDLLELKKNATDAKLEILIGEDETKPTLLLIDVRKYPSGTQQISQSLRVLKVDIDPTSPEIFRTKVLPEFKIDSNEPIQFGMSYSSDLRTLATKTASGGLRLFKWNQNQNAYVESPLFHQTVERGQILNVSPKGSRILVQPAHSVREGGKRYDQLESWVYVFDENGRQINTFDLPKAVQNQEKKLLFDGPADAENIYISTFDRKSRKTSLQILKEDGAFESADRPISPNSLVVEIAKFLNEHQEYGPEWLAKLDPEAIHSDLFGDDKTRNEIYVGVQRKDEFGNPGKYEIMVLAYDEVVGWYQARSK